MPHLDPYGDDFANKLVEFIAQDKELHDHLMAIIHRLTIVIIKETMKHVTDED